jgi:hypothetical protein
VVEDSRVGLMGEGNELIEGATPALPEGSSFRRI